MINLDSEGGVVGTICCEDLNPIRPVAGDREGEVYLSTVALCSKREYNELLYTVLLTLSLPVVQK